MKKIEIKRCLVCSTEIHPTSVRCGSCDQRGMCCRKKCPGCQLYFDNPRYYEKRGSRKFCSTECFQKSRWDTKNCLYCGVRFTRRKSIALEARFCSRQCASKSIQGEKISNWQQYRWSKMVRQRDGMCVECGSKDNLEADHIIPVYHNAEVALSIENGRTLCNKCHKNTPTYGKRVYLWSK